MAEDKTPDTPNGSDGRVDWSGKTDTVPAWFHDIIPRGRSKEADAARRAFWEEELRFRKGSVAAAAASRREEAQRRKAVFEKVGLWPAQYRGIFNDHLAALRQTMESDVPADDLEGLMKRVEAANKGKIP